MATSPTQLSLKKLKEDGWDLVAVVEHWNPFARVRQDLFGFIDILAINSKGDVLAVQTTTYSNMYARIKKITDHVNLPFVREANFKIEVHGWAKVKNRWQVKIKDIS